VSHNVRTGELEEWGFSCDPDSIDHEMNEWFKLNLDPEYKGPEGDPTNAIALRWYREYLSCVRAHTLEHLRTTIPRFAEKSVEFVFSVPTVSAAFQGLWLGFADAPQDLARPTHDPRD